jgi:hypothetical protein
VTLGIGGNDIGFSSIIESCGTLNPFSNPCRSRYIVARGMDGMAAVVGASVAANT